MTCVPLIRKIRVLSYLAILLLGLSPAFGQGTVEELHDPQDQYMYAHGLQDRKLYDRAEKLYRDFLAVNGGHRLAAEALAQISFTVWRINASSSPSGLARHERMAERTILPQNSQRQRWSHSFRSANGWTRCL